MSRPNPWTPLDLTRPAAHMRELAGLSLSEAAQRLDLAGPTAVHTAERREAGRGLSESAAGSMTLGGLLARARAYGLVLEVRVRRA